MENRYWMVCEQYWEPTGTATEPASATMTPESTTATAPVFTTKTTSTNRASTAQPDSSAASNPAAADIGLSVGAQAGIGIGVALAVLLAALAVFLWFRERKKRRSLETKLVEVNNSLNGLAYLAEKKGGSRSQVFEMEGEHIHRQELRGCARTPELKGSSPPPPVGVCGGGDDDNDGISTRYSYGTSTAGGSPRGYGAGIGVALGGTDERSPHASSRSEGTLGSPGSLKPAPLALSRSRDSES